MDRADLPLDEDIAELNREAQKAVDREIAARIELDAAISNRVAVRAKLSDGSGAAIAFIDNYVNPVKPNPEPVAPEVAAPPPAVEPPVFTSVDSADLTPETTSGGAAEVVADELNVIEAPAEGEGAGSTGGAVGTLGE
jgi:hypothetical protein